MEQKRKKVGLFTLGITLILLGAAILVNQFSDYKIIEDFYLLWPAFLILLGLEFIITKLYYDFRKEDVHLSPSILSIFLVIVILFTSVLWSNINLKPFSFDLNFRDNWNLDFLGYTEQIREELVLEEISLEGTEKLEVKNLRGMIRVEPWEQNTLKVQAEIIVDTNNKEESKELLGNVIKTDVGNTASIEVNNPYSQNTRDHQLNAVNLTIRVPKDLDIDLSTRFGEVYAADMLGSVAVSQEHSRVELSNISGNAAINSRHTSMRIIGIEGDVKVINEHGEVVLEDITGSLDVANSYNSTFARNIGKDVKIRSRHGQVRLEDTKGNADIENEYNNTSCINIEGDLSVNSRHGAVIMENIAGNIAADNSYNSIRLTNGNYDNSHITADTTYNQIFADREIGLDIDDDRNAQSASAINGNGSQRISLKNHHGEIRIEIR